MAWNQIVVMILVLILVIVIYIGIKKSYAKGSWLLPRSAFEIFEKIRCSLKREPCLSIYPSRVKQGEKVFVTIRTIAAYRGQKACFTRDRNSCPRFCEIGNRSMCSFNFTASLDDSGSYFAFIDINTNKELDDEEPRSESHNITVIS